MTPGERHKKRLKNETPMQAKTLGDSVIGDINDMFPFLFDDKF